LIREVGLGIQGNRSPQDYARIAALAEQYGFDVLSVFSDFTFQPAIFPLLIAAQHSQTIRLGPACLNPFTLHPTEIASQIASLDLASNGRAYLGLARGSWLDRAGIKQARPLTALREAATVVRMLLAADTSGYRGELFSITPGTRLQFEARRATVPLLLGTWSPKTAALAGEIADEVKIGGTANPAMVRRMRQMIEVGTRKAGRSGDAVRIVVGAVTVVDHDAAAALRIAESAARMYVEVIGHLDTTLTKSVEKQFTNFAFAGTPEMVASQAHAMFEAGASRVEFGSPYGASWENGLRLLGEEVLPRLKG
jgi:5,10-methylenetetrahydromethanopterin reductase